MDKVALTGGSSVWHGGHPFFRSVAPRIADAVGPTDLPILTRGVLGTDVPLPAQYDFYNTEDLHHAQKQTPAYRHLLSSARTLYDYAEPNLLIEPSAIFRPILLGPINTAAAIATCDIDVLFFGCVTSRRAPILAALHATVIDRHYAEDLERWVRRARIVLSLGAYDAVTNDTFRVFPALECGGRLVIEACQEAWFNAAVAPHATVVTYKDLVFTCHQLLVS